jgi:hypothetical protein
MALNHERLVYVICADKRLKYENGYSSIAYIGTTRNGITRMAASAAHRSWDVLWSRGVKSFDVRIVTCRARPGVKSWVRLERALILAFREKYGEPPMCNVQGRRMKVGKAFETFSFSRLNQVIDALSDGGPKKERTAIVDTIDTECERDGATDSEQFGGSHHDHNA